MAPFRNIGRIFSPLFIFSLVSNLAVLISPIFMMQVLDRVIPSGNLNTLALLFAIALVALGLQCLVEAARELCLSRLAGWIETEGTKAAHNLNDQRSQDMIDLVARTAKFLKGRQAIAALNLPWLPLLALALTFLNPWFLVLLIALSALSGGMKAIEAWRSKALANSKATLERQEIKDLKNMQIAAHAPGLAFIGRELVSRLIALRQKRAELMHEGDVRSSFGNSAVNILRSCAQISTLCLGALLVTQGALTAGGMIAASILLAKSFATIEASLAEMGALRAALNDLRQLQKTIIAQQKVTQAQTFEGHLKAEGLIFPRGGGAPPILDRVSFELTPGQCLVILGPSGSGKSTLIAALAGLSPCPIGAVFMDQSEVKSLSSTTFAQHFGYLGQIPTLLAGTIAENISGFRSDATPEQIIEAAKTAGVHGMISALPNTYETQLPQDAAQLSEGQKQRIALARAIYTKPKYLFLDEPNALLDAESERAFLHTIEGLKKKGTTVLLALHRAGLMPLADCILRLENGRAVDFGPRADVLGRMSIGVRQITLPLLLTSLQDLRDWVAAQFTRDGDALFRNKTQLVAEELFTAARENGAQNKAREATIRFTFGGDAQCELLLIEKALPKDSDLTRLQAVVQKPPLDDSELHPNERAMANLTRLTDMVDVQKIENKAVFRATISCASAHLNRNSDKMI